MAASNPYLKRRKQGWYFQIAVPATLRGKPPWGKKAVIVLSLGTRDLSLAQKLRWAKVDEYTEAFRRAAGDIPLTRAEINDEAWRVYQDTLRRLEASPVSIEPERDESPEHAGLWFHMSNYTEALDTGDYTVQGLHDDAPDINIVAGDLAAVQQRTGTVFVEGTESYRLLTEAILRAKVAALSGRMAALENNPSEPPATFVTGGIDRVTLKPVALGSASCSVCL
jgi:hypothetical protein